MSPRQVLVTVLGLAAAAGLLIGAVLSAPGAIEAVLARINPLPPGE